MLKQWEPFGRAVPVRDLFDRVFEGGFVRPVLVTAGAGAARGGAPFDLYEEGDRYVVVAALPGVDAAKLDVSVNRNLLTIRGERAGDAQAGEAQNGRIWHLRGLPQGRFEIATALPGEVDTAAVDAEYASGLLTVRLPKSDAARARTISVRAGDAHRPELAAALSQ